MNTELHWRTGSVCSANCV